MWTTDPARRDERRARAHKAAFDAEGGPFMDGVRSLEIAIESATRVKITDDVIALAMGAIPRSFVVSDGLRASIRRNLTAALIELGFEVEEE